MLKVNPYATKVLDPTVHGRLVADIDKAAVGAGIQPRWIWTPLGDTVSESEVSWVKRFRFHEDAGKTGLSLEGRDPDPDPETRMSAIAGALTRNFINARVMTLNHVLDWLKDGDVPKMTCLLIPNFFVEKAQGGSTAHWQVSALYDLLLERHTLGLQTVIYASDMKALGTEYGRAMQRHIEKHFYDMSIEQ